MAPAASDKPTYQKDEKSLCFHGELLYEAKILDIKKEDPKDKSSAWEYKVHYKGWKNTWDDWVTQDRLRKNTEENRELAANLKKAAYDAQKSAKAPPKARKSQGADLASRRGSEDRTSSIPARGTKRARDNDIEKAERASSTASSPGSTAQSPEDDHSPATVSTGITTPEVDEPSEVFHTAIGTPIKSRSLALPGQEATTPPPQTTSSTVHGTPNSTQTLVSPLDILADAAVGRIVDSVALPKLQTENEDEDSQVEDDVEESEADDHHQEHLAIKRRAYVKAEAHVGPIEPPKRDWHAKLPAKLTLWKFLRHHEKLNKDDNRNAFQLQSCPEARRDYIDYLNRDRAEQFQLTELTTEEILALARAPADRPEYKVSDGPAFAPLIGGTTVGELDGVNQAVQRRLAELKRNGKKAYAAIEDEYTFSEWPAQEEIPGMPRKSYRELGVKPPFSITDSTRSPATSSKRKSIDEDTMDPETTKSSEPKRRRIATAKVLDMAVDQGEDTQKQVKAGKTAPAKRAPCQPRRTNVEPDTDDDTRASSEEVTATVKPAKTRKLAQGSEEPNEQTPEPSQPMKTRKRARDSEEPSLQPDSKRQKSSAPLLEANADTTAGKDGEVKLRWEACDRCKLKHAGCTHKVLKPKKGKSTASPAKKRAKPTTPIPEEDTSTPAAESVAPRKVGRPRKAAKAIPLSDQSEDELAADMHSAPAKPVTRASRQVTQEPNLVNSTSEAATQSDSTEPRKLRKNSKQISGSGAGSTKARAQSQGPAQSAGVKKRGRPAKSQTSATAKTNVVKIGAVSAALQAGEATSEIQGSQFTTQPEASGSGKDKDNESETSIVAGNSQ